MESILKFLGRKFQIAIIFSTKFNKHKAKKNIVSSVVFCFFLLDKCEQIQINCNIEGLSNSDNFYIAENKLHHKSWWFGDNGFSIYYNSHGQWEITNYNLVFTSSTDENYNNDFPSSGNYFDNNGNEHEFEISCVENEVEGTT